MPEKKSWMARLFPQQAQKLAVDAANWGADQAAKKIKAAIPGFYGAWNRSAGAKYPGGNSAPLGGITWNHWQARQQARDIVHDSPIAGALVYRWADSVVGSGLTVIPEPQFDILGITPEAADEWATARKEEFLQWCSSKKQHRAGTTTFLQAQHLIQVESERDNDYFVRLYYSPDKSLVNPLQFEVIDANQIRGDAITSTLLVGRFSDGIERGPDGVERLFKIWRQADESSGGYEEVDIPKIGPGGKLNMIHGFQAEYAGQGRGLAPLSATLQEFEFIEDFQLAEVQKAVNHASINMVTENMQQAPGNPFDQLGVQAAGPSTIVAGSPGALAGVGATAVSLQAQVNYAPIEEALIKQPGISVFGLNTGDKLIPFQSTSPNAEYGGFIDSNVSYLAARHSMPMSILKIMFGSNYSASRGEVVIFWRNVDMKRDRLDLDLIAPIYEMWLGGQIAAGKTSCPGWQDPVLRAAWLGHRVNGPPMPNIDPEKTAKADQLYLELGAQTAEDVSRNFNGSAFKSNVMRLAKEMEKLSAVKMPWNQPGNPPPVDGAPTTETPNQPKKPQGASKK